MRVFLTGATGFIGSRIVPELLSRGHRVTGVTRSDAGAQALQAQGAEIYRGVLEEPEALAAGAADADAVIHCAFDHDFTHFMANCEKDERVLSALGAVLKGSERPLLFTSGVGFGQPSHGALAVETVANFDHPNPRSLSEKAGARLLDEGVKVMVMRLPQVHDTHKQGLITPWIDFARRNGAVNYVGAGANRFSAAHVDDVAHLYVLALEGGRAGERFHAVDEEGVEARLIAETLGRSLSLPVASVSPEEAPEKLGFMAMFATLDLPASGFLTQERLGWTPKGPGLIADLEGMDVSAPG